MIEIGKVQKLEVININPKGVYLNESGSKGSDAFLGKKEVSVGTKVGDKLEVFVYVGSNDKLVATKIKPKLTVGEIGLLRVVDTSKIGAFLDWGVDKDLFLPFKEQGGRVEKGSKYLVGVYIDKSNRPCATMKIKNLLRTDSPYKENDKTVGIIYSINPDMGAFVAVDKTYDGLIPKNELYGVFRPGDEVDIRITKVREDGRLYLSLRTKSYKQIDKDGDTIIYKIKQNGGELKLNDHSSPKRIREELNMSKSSFKKAVGRLLKEGKIVFSDKGIRFKKM